MKTGKQGKILVYLFSFLLVYLIDFLRMTRLAQCDIQTYVLAITDHAQ